MTRLTHAPLVRLNRVTGDYEPWLAEKWAASPDGRVFTLTLRDGVKFSDGVPFTSADVVFTFRALYDPSVNSSLASGVKVQGKPLQVVRDGSAHGRRHASRRRSRPASRCSTTCRSIRSTSSRPRSTRTTFGTAWGTATKPGTMAGLGPFVVGEYVPGQRMTFTRNPHYWQKDAAGVALPYLDSIVMEFLASQDAEMLRLQAGSADLMTQADVRPEDIAALRAAPRPGGAADGRGRRSASTRTCSGST